MKFLSVGIISLVSMAAAYPYHTTSAVSPTSTCQENNRNRCFATCRQQYLLEEYHGRFVRSRRPGRDVDAQLGVDGGQASTGKDFAAKIAPILDPSILVSGDLTDGSVAIRSLVENMYLIVTNAGLDRGDLGIVGRNDGLTTQKSSAPGVIFVNGIVENAVCIDIEDVLSRQMILVCPDPTHVLACSFAYSLFRILSKRSCQWSIELYIGGAQVGDGVGYLWLSRGQGSLA
ncbi:hypothetical protein E5D57_005694 [Metarhizium anisopliae]|nr:hypothetical protein E5D57_005694 [Metarhizium anisopliae]